MVLSFECSATIDAAARRVFVALTEPEVLSEWLPDRVRVERLSERSWRQQRKFPSGAEVDDVYTLHSSEAPSRFVTRIEGGQAVIEITWSLDAVKPETTHLRAHAVLSGLGKWTELLARVFLGGVQKTLEADLAALKDHLEQRVQ